MRSTAGGAWRRCVVAAAVMVALAGTAWAQDYTVTMTSGLLEATPASATTMPLITNNSAGLSLPFDFPYYGRFYSDALITTSGFVILGRSAAVISQQNVFNDHGQPSSTSTFPYSTSGLGGAGAQNVDGLIAPCWGALYVNPYGSNPAYLRYWTSGAAPNRRFLITWENTHFTSGNNFTVQLQLFETSGRVVFAYSSGSWTQAQFALGLDAPSDSRYIAPLGTSYPITSAPGVDYVFDARTVTYTGSLQFDRLVTDSSGIGNSVDPGVPIARCRVELRRDGGILVNAATTAADGAFSISGVGVASTSSGDLKVVAENVACRVAANSGGARSEWTAASGLSYATGSGLGAITLGYSGDSSGALRAPFNVARVCLAVRDWAAARAIGSIPRVDAFVDATAQFPTSYTAAPAMYVGSAAGGNSDVWDDSIITKTHARHVLASIAALPTTTADYRFDAVSDTQNAFAEAFGCYLWAAVSNSFEVIDGKSASSAAVYDLENPTITVSSGPDVAGCVAAGLTDLLDGANETVDPVNGTTLPEQVLQVVDGFLACPTASTFLQAWTDAGFDAQGITRIFVGDGVLSDDTFEPNDAWNEARPLGPVGLRRSGLVLNRFNEDWFSVTLPADAPSFEVDATYDHVSVAATVGVEIRNAAGALLASALPVGSSGVVHVATGPATAGTYRVGVRHLGGVTVPSYGVQAYARFALTPSPLVDWTVGRDYDRDLGVTGGIAPFVVATVSSSAPPGLVFDPAALHAAGRPTVPGAYPLTIQVTDAGSPANVLLTSQTVVIHDVLKLPLPAFVGFPADRPVDVTLPTHEGTPPFTLSMTAGALPTGLAFGPNSLHVTGTAAPGSSALELDGVDVAGSADHVATRAVAAVQLVGKTTTADLAAGEDACGWWFDAVAGSTVGFSVKTVRGQTKRALTGVVLAPDRGVVATGKVKSGLGFATGANLVCPQSGRYYLIASSTDAGPATQLTGAVAVAPPKSGKATFKTFAPSDETTIEVGAFPGATLVLKFGGDKRKALTARLVSVTDPSGAPVPSVADFVKPNAVGGTLTLTLPTAGTWTIVLAATSGSGEPGKLTWSYSVKQPKGATYSAD
jgi:hypothetical protein